MDTPKSANVRATVVNSGEGTEAADVFGGVQGRNGAVAPAQRQEHRADGVGAGDRRHRAAALGGAGGDRSGTRTRRALKRSEREELVELRRENQRLRMEREILKKATAFFAKQSE